MAVGKTAEAVQLLRKAAAPRPGDVRLDHTFVDILHDLPNGFVQLDLTRLHDTQPVPEVMMPDQESAVSAS